MSPPSPERRYAVAMLLLANLFWGLSFPVIKAVTDLNHAVEPGAGNWFSAIYAIAPRFVLAALLLGAWHWREWRRTTRLELQQGVVMGAFAAGGMLLQNDGLQFTAASTSAFLTQLYAVMIPLWLALHHRRNPGWRVWTSCLLVLVGVATLGRFDPRPLVQGLDGAALGRGEIETLLSSFFFMGQILWLEKKAFAANRPERLTLVMFATEAVVFSALLAVTTPSATALLPPWRSSAWVGLTGTLTVFCTIGAFSLMNRWQPKITATEAGLIYCIEPIFGSVLSLFLPAWFSAWGGINYPNEHLTWTLLVGGGLITAANLLLQLNPPPKS